MRRPFLRALGGASHLSTWGGDPRRGTRTFRLSAGRVRGRRQVEPPARSAPFRKAVPVTCERCHRACFVHPGLLHGGVTVGYQALYPPSTKRSAPVI